MPRVLFIDESGDLGWTFNAPYGNGGSSRYLTIAMILCPRDKTKIINRFARDMRIKLGLNSGHEIKGSAIPIINKELIANGMLKILNDNSDINLLSITTYKQNVMPHIRSDSNKLYNYMIRWCAGKLMANFVSVELCRDEKGIKVKSGNALVDYIQTELWFTHKSQVIVTDNPVISHNNYNIQCVDWMAHAVWNHYERQNSLMYNILKPKLNDIKLYF